MRFDRPSFFASYRDTFSPSNGGRLKLTQSQVQGLETLLSFLESDPFISDLRHAAYMLATVKHECADTYLPIIERGTRSYFLKYDPHTPLGRSLGNARTGDGYLYRGRGYVQITGRDNYRRFRDRLWVRGYLPQEKDLILRPDLALLPHVAYAIMSLGMRAGLFTGKSLSDYIEGQTCDYLHARRIINRLDKAEMIAEYAEGFEHILRVSSRASLISEPENGK